MITIKEPVRFIAVVTGTAAYFIFGDVHLGFAFLFGAFAASFSVKLRS